MQDTKLFETILGITAPWHISRVELKIDEKRVDLWLEHESTPWSCPECTAEAAGFDHPEERTWRHLDTCQFETAATLAGGRPSRSLRQLRCQRRQRTDNSSKGLRRHMRSHPAGSRLYTSRSPGAEIDSQPRS